MLQLQKLKYKDLGLKKTIISALLATIVTGCAQDKVMELTGVIKVKGSEPHTYVVIKDSTTNREYKIVNHSKLNLSQRQNKVVKINAKLIKKPLGPGFPAIVELVE